MFYQNRFPSEKLPRSWHPPARPISSPRAWTRLIAALALTSLLAACHSTLPARTPAFDIAAAVRDSFRRDLYLSRDGIDVSEAGGRVVLRGFVDAPFKRRRAVRIARQQPGVRQVVDRLVVRPNARAYFPESESVGEIEFP
ncbi:MAG TPA: BON domain-containing protein [Elusimicrobiota bacterium]|nr:BON domain-containing protein [Elusimicrobiota bacterium]